MRSIIESLVAPALCCCVLFFSTPAQSQTYTTGRTLVSLVKDNTRVSSHLGQVAEFGNPLLDRANFAANLYLPPGDQTLCEYPEALMNKTSSDLDYAWNIPIALFVARGKCSFDQKARIAVEIQTNFSSQMKFVIVYNNNPSRPQELLIMSSSSFGDHLDDLKSVGFIFVSTDSGAAILSAVAGTVISDERSPYLSYNESYGWSLPTLIEKLPDQPSPSSNPTSVNNAFHWLRFILFSLLIVSPCVRAGFLWYSAGGRFLLRRNEEGRIIGIIYVRPMSYWFASGSPEQDDAKEDRRLTEAQILALPEITYRAPVEDEDVVAPESPPVDPEAPQPQMVIVSPKNASVDPERIEDDNAFELETDNGVSTPKSTAELPSNDMSIVEQALESTTISGSEYSISCTMCSICIDDFEEGEKVRVLPRCRHGFHLECIKPWLMERQGCCPLCKNPVVEPEGNEPVVEEGIEDRSQRDPPA
jgi:hypothetical protein